jgi:hypothetical protein
LQAVERNGLLFHNAAGDLNRDFDLALVAFANINDLIMSFELFDEDLHFLTRFFAYVQERLQDYANFQLIIYSILTENNDSPLSRLNQGQETFQVYKKNLAAYLNTPVGKELRLLRRASVNLRNLKGIKVDI